MRHLRDVLLLGLVSGSFVACGGASSDAFSDGGGDASDAAVSSSSSSVATSSSHSATGVAATTTAETSGMGSGSSSTDSAGGAGDPSGAGGTSATGTGGDGTGGDGTGGDGTGGDGTGGDGTGGDGTGGDAPTCDGEGVAIGRGAGAISADDGVFVYNSGNTRVSDVLVVEHWFQYGAVDGPQTITFSGENYADCAVCVVLLVDCEGDLCRRFLVESGTLRVDTLDIDDFSYAATLEDAVATEVTISGGTSAPVPDGDTWCLDGVEIGSRSWIRLPVPVSK